MEENKMWIDLKALRFERGWLQRETAKKLGVSRSYISSLENRKRTISMNMMGAIMKVFNVGYDDFSHIKPSGSRS